MESSDRPRSLLEEEVVRVHLQAESAWSALRHPMGAAFEENFQSAHKEARELCGQTPFIGTLRLRLCHDQHLIKRAAEHAHSMLSPAKEIFS